MTKIKVYDGTINGKVQEYSEIGCDASLVGKTIAAVGSGKVEGPNGPEPMTVLFFTDKTRHGFVHPQD